MLVEEVKARIVSAFPELENDMEFLDSWTPLTYERYCNAYHGSYMSFITTPAGKQIKMKGRLKEINNLYVAGQWTNSPGGLPVAAAGGKGAVSFVREMPCSCQGASGLRCRASWKKCQSIRQWIPPTPNGLSEF